MMAVAVHTPSRTLRPSFHLSFRAPFTCLFLNPFAVRGAVLSPFERLSPPFEAYHFSTPLGGMRRLL